MRRVLSATIVTLCLLAPAHPAVAQGDLRMLEQGWSVKTREGFWFTSQGSNILPYDWFLYLEEAASTELFRRPEHMDEFRYITLSTNQNPSQLNPDGLPIGFIKDSDTNGLGLSCAACHTNRIDVGNASYLVEGAPTLADFVRFFGELIDALEKTDEDTAKFDRFARKVLGSEYSTSAAEDLHAELHKLALRQGTRQQVNSLPSPSYPKEYPGYARLDAFGNIMNQVVAMALGDPNNGHLSNGPVSYPFLWGTPQSNVVQWNGSAPNTLFIGPLVRNVGEVVGVFGRVEIQPRKWWQFWKKLGYESKISMVELGHLESWLWSLRAPRWEDTSLPPIDDALAVLGEEVYAGNCASCHQVVPQDQRYDAVMVPVSVVGTDRNMAFNFTNNRAKTLRLEGTRKQILVGEKFGSEAASIDSVVNAVLGVLLRDPIQALEGMKIGHSGADEKSRAQMKTDLGDLGDDLEGILREQSRQVAPPDGVDSYKARPLTGIWATAPYLHNGSVPNLRELLLPPAKRSGSFNVGSREYDPADVGFVTWQTPNSTRFDTSVSGNSNAGHEYGVDLSDDQKEQLLEYLKSF